MTSGMTFGPRIDAALFQIPIDFPCSCGVTVVPVDRAQGKLSQGFHHRLPIPNQFLKVLHGLIRMAEVFLADRKLVLGQRCD